MKRNIFHIYFLKIIVFYQHSVYNIPNIKSHEIPQNIAQRVSNNRHTN